MRDAMAIPANRSLRLTFAGELLQGHAIPVYVITKALTGAQLLLVHLAESQVSRFRERGQTGKIGHACRLMMSPPKANCFTAVLSLADERDDRLPAEVLLCEKALSDAKKSMLLYSTGDTQGLEALCPHPMIRRRVASDLSLIAPPRDANYSVRFSGTDCHRHRLVQPSQKAIDTLTSWKPSAREHSAPMLIQARGLAELSPDGLDFERWVKLYDMSRLDLDDTHRTRMVEWGQIALRLARPIDVTIEQLEPELFLASFAPLNILANGRTRDEAVDEFQHEFVVIWHEIALCPDADLAEDAIELKKRIMELVTREAE